MNGSTLIKLFTLRVFGWKMPNKKCLLLSSGAVILAFVPTPETPNFSFIFIPNAKIFRKRLEKNANISFLHLNK